MCSAIIAIAWSKDGKRILTGSSDNKVMLWEAANGKHLKTITGHQSSVYAVAFTPDGKKAIS